MSTDQINKSCLSSFLAFRYVVNPNDEWISGIAPTFPQISDNDQISVSNKVDIINNLKKIIKKKINNSSKIGLFLSGGIDSAILAKFLPEGTNTYSIKFVADGAIDESIMAQKYAENCNHKFKVIEVDWKDYEESSNYLMQLKKSPLHAIEVALYKAALEAKNDGVQTIFVGNGADSTFGGMDKLLSKDWSFDEFIKRYTFVRPELVLQNPVDITHVYSPFKVNNSINVIAFLKNIHGTGIIQSFTNSIKAASLDIAEPYEALRLSSSLDIKRIRNGEPKYLLYSIFNELYPDISPPRKIPFARPMDKWLSNWSGPINDIFRSDINLSMFSGDQKWLIYSLDKFISLILRGKNI